MNVARSNYVVHLVVRDLNASRRFYVDLLGCTESPGAGGGLARYRFVGDMGLVLAEPGAIPELGDEVSRGVRLLLPVPDVEAARHVLQSRSAEPLSPLENGAWGRWLALTDPDGNAVWLVEPPRSRVPL